ncbi:MAG: hypothetical protein AAF503_01565 [Pseudomonadota bacterium]
MQTPGSELPPATGSHGPLQNEPGSLPLPEPEVIRDEAAATIEAIESFDPMAMVNAILGIEIPPVVMGIIGLIVFFIVMIFAFAPRTPSAKELEKYRPNSDQKQVGPT